VRSERNFSHGGAEDVGGSNKSERQRARELLGFIEVQRTEERHALLRLFHGIERQGWHVLAGPRLVVVRRVFFLQVSGVGKQDATQIDGGRGRVDGAVKSLLHQARNPSRMIEVGVRQDDGVNRIRRYRQGLAVA